MYWFDTVFLSLFTFSVYFTILICQLLWLKSKSLGPPNYLVVKDGQTFAPVHPQIFFVAMLLNVLGTLFQLNADFDC